MKLCLFTICKNAMPWIACHYPIFRQLAIQWEWHVVEGTALPEHCTSWCAALRPGLSDDGTTEYLDSLAFDSRVFLTRSESWHGKISMVNEALRYLNEPCILMEVDADELWTAEQIRLIHKTFTTQKINAMRFRCRYFVGPDIVITTDNCFGNRNGEWQRAWRYEPGMRFRTHEPPAMDGFTEKGLDQRATANMGLVFDHMAYATEAQMRFKVEYYGGPKNPLGHLYSLDGWKRLQQHSRFPARVADFLPFVQDESMCARIPL